MKSLIGSIIGRCGALGSRRGAHAARRAGGTELFERFEPRTLLATFTVTSLADAGAGSLRQAIADANGAAGADVVEFSVAGTITLTGGELLITESLAINGPGAGSLSVSGNDASRVMRFSAGTSSLDGLTITGGNAFSGGGIVNDGTLTVTDAVISGNSATTGGGAGIENNGTLTVTGSTISGNDAGIGDGGGIRNAGTLTVSGSTISGNVAVNGGGIAAFGASMAVTNSTLSGNTASIGGAAIINFNVATVRNTTIAGNVASSCISNSGTLTMTSTIVAGTAANMVGTYAVGSSNNLIQVSANAGGLTNGVNGNIIGSDPLLGALADNGGPVMTMALQAGSPAIDAGANPDSLTTDSRGAGFVRVRGAAIDIGSFESNASPTIASLTAAPSSVTRGQGFTLTANTVADADGTVSRVDFYRDLNGNGAADGGELVGSDTVSGDGFSLVVASTAGYPLGGTQFLAIAVDNDGASSAVSLTSVTVANALPTIASLTPSASTAARGQSVTLTANTVADSDGTVARVDFYRDINGNGAADGGELLGSDSTSGDGFSLGVGSTVGFPLGSTQFLAIAVDSDGGSSVISTAAVTFTDALPTIGSLSASAPAIVHGQSLVLTANTVADADGTVTQVNFYRDANTNGVADTGELIGSDADPAGGYTLTVDTTALAYGSVQFLAVAVDNDSGAGAAVSAAVGIVHPFGSAPGQLLGASAGATGNLNVTTQNGAGTPIVLQQAAGASTWTASDLQAKTGCPEVTGEVVSWVDPKDGRTYAAANSVDGLLLFTNTTESTWTFRNLSTEVAGIPAITGNLTVFTSTDSLVNIAGTAASGDLIRWQQTGASTGGNYAWTAGNLADDLRAQSLTVPQFTGRITSFVTPWNALNVVGLDAAGQIQAVWWHQSLNTGGKWTTNNLSAEYGAPPLTGGLTVWLTSWSAINIAGTDTDGKLSATWWVPNYNDNHWQTDNLTDEFGGPLLQANSMSSWVTSWGAMNIAGREADGTTSVYWWVPGYNNNQWQVAFFRDILPGATLTTGPVTGLTAPGGDYSMSILSTSAAGDIIRYWWSPTSNVWAEQNLTQTAVAI